MYFRIKPNSPTPLTDDWKVMDDSSVDFQDVFFFIFCYNLAKNEEKHVMEMDESSVTFQSSISGAGEFGHKHNTSLIIIQVFIV